MRKAFNRFEASQRRTPEDCERYYAEVHTKVARELLVDQPNVLSYTQYRVERQLDGEGAWDAERTAWRFVAMLSKEKSSGPGAAPVATGLDTRQALAKVHAECLRNLRRTLVEEEVLLDRRGPRTRFVPFLFEYDRRTDTSTEEARKRLQGIVSSLAPDWESAFGLRLVVLNTVQDESKAIPIHEPGQELTDELLDETDKVGYLQFYFDDPEWAERYFAESSVRSVLMDDFFAVANGYHVAERCVFDRR